MSTRPRPGRLFIFGWDGADWAVIEEGWRRGKLSTLRALVERGQSGILRSTNPPLTPPAWTSFITGVNPGTHGIFGFVSVDRETYRMSLVPGGARRVPSLWAGLDRHGYRTAMVTVPWTFPAERLSNGVVVPGWDAPDETFDSTHPSDFARDLAATVPRVPRKTSVRLVNLKPRVVLSAQEEKIELKERICRFVLERHDPEVFMMVFTEPDSAGHLLWTRGPIPQGLVDAYDQVDASMGRLMARHVGDDDAVLVVSDHGTQPFHTYVHMGSLLASGGFLTVASGTREPRIATAKRQVWGRIPPGIRARVNRYAPDRLRTVGDHARRRAQVDWSRTVAFPVGTELVSLGVAINASSRFSRGIVEPGEYERVRDKVCRFLSDLRDPKNGRVVFPRVHRREEIYEGPALEDAPDIMVSFTEGYGVRFGLKVTQPISRSAFGGHRVEGIYVMSPSIGLAPTEEIDRILPRVFEARGLPVEAGVPMSERVSEGYSKEEAQEIEARLRNLGYME